MAEWSDPEVAVVVWADVTWATSITVTAPVGIRGRQGSPERWTIMSAWRTEALGQKVG